MCTNMMGDSDATIIGQQKSDLFSAFGSNTKTICHIFSNSSGVSVAASVYRGSSVRLEHKPKMRLHIWNQT